MNNNGWERWLHVGGSIASLAALGYLLTHLPRRGERVAVAGLKGLPEFPDLMFDLETLTDPAKPPKYWLTVRTVDGRLVGETSTDREECTKGQYLPIRSSWITESYRGRGLYPAMLSLIRDKAKAAGCRGIQSHNGETNTLSDDAVASWTKFAAREPRVTAYPQFRVFYLDGLPKTGRIPMKTAQRALKKLPKRSRACKGMTAAALREGMEIEREHRDITQGRVGQTAKIAAAHICERPDYYKRIKRYVEK